MTAADDASPASDAVGDAGPSNLVNGDFELGCAGWHVEYADLTVVSTAHGGKTACMLCSDHDGYQITQDVDSSALVADKKYVVEAWLRRMPADGGATGDGYIEVPQFDETGGSPYPTGESGNVPMTDEWQRVTAIITAGSNAKRVEIRIGSTKPGTCIVVDDASLRELR